MSQEYGRVYRASVDLPIGWLLTLGYLLVLLGTSDMGFCRDEGYYFKAGRLYITWVQNLVEEIRTGKPKRSLTRAEIEKYWTYNSEHPPIAKLAMGATWWLFSQKLGWMSNSTGFRFAGMIWASLMILIIYLWGVRAWNRRMALFAAFAMMLLPRFFFHAHLAAFDIPVSALWLFVAYAFWRSLQTPAWAIGCGILAGLALATKHNAWILPVPLALYWLCQTWTQFQWKILPNGTHQFRLPPLPQAIWATLLFAPIILLASWPLLWPTNWLDPASWKSVTFSWLGQYVRFHLFHVHYDAYYFGTLHLEPPFPWLFPVVMTIFTFPVVTVVLISGGFWFLLRQQRLGTHFVWWFARGLHLVFGLLKSLLSLVISLALLIPLVLLTPLLLILLLLEGLGRLLPGGPGSWVREWLTYLRNVLQSIQEDIHSWISEKPAPPLETEHRFRPVGPVDKTGLFWILNAFFPIFLIALPSTPIFGGTKHWMPAWPFLALMAGLCFERILVSMRSSMAFSSPSLRLLGPWALGSLFLLPALIGLVRVHPHGLAYYNTLLGGPRGSANWKMQRSFWAPTMRQALPWMKSEMKGWPRPDGSHDPNVWVHFHDTNWDSYQMYLQDRLIDPRIKATWSPTPPTRYIAFIHQKWLRTQLMHSLSILGASAPVYGIYVDDAPLLTFWERETDGESRR